MVGNIFMRTTRVVEFFSLICDFSKTRGDLLLNTKEAESFFVHIYRAHFLYVNIFSVFVNLCESMRRKNLSRF